MIHHQDIYMALANQRHADIQQSFAAGRNRARTRPARLAAARSHLGAALFGARRPAHSR